MRHLYRLHTEAFFASGGSQIELIELVSGHAEALKGSEAPANHEN